MTAFARAFEAAATGQALPTETPGERDPGARPATVGLRPVEAAATIAQRRGGVRAAHEADDEARAAQR